MGVEGGRDDGAVNDRGDRHQRNLIATMFVSQGGPMLTAGDELGKTQGGNNNGYCQDNEISWIDWDLDDRRSALLGFTTIAGASFAIAKFLAGLFLLLFLVFLVIGLTAARKIID